MHFNDDPAKAHAGQSLSLYACMQSCSASFANTCPREGGFCMRRRHLLCRFEKSGTKTSRRPCASVSQLAKARCKISVTTHVARSPPMHLKIPIDSINLRKFVHHIFRHRAPKKRCADNTLCTCWCISFNLARSGSLADLTLPFAASCRHMPENAAISV